jgi:hypothetical protein
MNSPFPRRRSSVSTLDNRISLDGGRGGGVAGVEGGHHPLGERWRTGITAGPKGGGRGVSPMV